MLLDVHLFQPFFELPFNDRVLLPKDYLQRRKFILTAVQNRTWKAEIMDGQSGKEGNRLLTHCQP